MKTVGLHPFIFTKSSVHIFHNSFLYKGDFFFLNNFHTRLNTLYTLHFTHFHDMSRLCELNCGYFCIALIQNAINDHFFWNSYLSQLMFTISKTLCNYSIFGRHLDTLFETMNFQFKTGQNLNHCRSVVLKLFLSFPTLNKGAFSSPTCPSLQP